MLTSVIPLGVINLRANLLALIQRNYMKTLIGESRYRKDRQNKKRSREEKHLSRIRVYAVQK